MKWAGVIAIAVSAGLELAMQTSPPQTIWDGIYTKAQATRGEQSYKQACGYCHRDNLQGDEGPALVGSRFTYQWRDQSVKDLFVAISTRMPDDAPGSLPAQTYSDIVAFLLNANDAPAGDIELTPDLDALARLRFTEKPPKR